MTILEDTDDGLVNWCLFYIDNSDEMEGKEGKEESAQQDIDCSILWALACETTTPCL